MALSFQDSLKAAQAENEAVAAAASLPAVADGASIMTLGYDAAANDGGTIVAYAGDDGNWIQDTRYLTITSFYDENISTIDDEKNVDLNKKQFNITQEENSQYIPFEMSRYYDGYDLSKATLSIHYEASDGRHGVSIPINVTYNDAKLRFGWLADAAVTYTPGKMKFEIHATGIVIDRNGNIVKDSNNNNLGYVWKSKINEKLNVLQSLCDEDCYGVINLDDSWITELVTMIATSVGNEIKDANLSGYATDAEVNAKLENYALTSQIPTIPSNVSAFTNDMNYVTAGGLNQEFTNRNYVDKTYVDNAVASVDVSEQLESYALATDVQDINVNLANNYYTKSDADQKITSVLTDGKYATETYVEEQIAAADISSKLENYYKKDETYNRQEIDTALDNVSVDLSGYATEIYVDNADNALSAKITTNTENISSLSATLSSLQSDVNAIDKSPRLTYDVAYNDVENPDVGENVFVLYEITNEGQENETKEAKQKFTIVGGSGGSSTSSVLKIGYVTTSPLVVTIDDSAIIKYTFTGADSSGDVVTEGNATWKVAGVVVATNIALNGENEFDVTEYLSIGTQKVTLSITDDAGSLVSKTWTVQKIDVRLESTFNDKLTYPIGAVSFDYIPYGAVSKDVHFILDGKEIGTVTTSSSGIPMAYEIPAQEHGSHLLEVYMTTEINGNSIESNHILKDILWYDETRDVPVIGTTYQSFTARQYDSTNIEYTVYDPTTETPAVSIAVNGEIVSTPTLTKSTNTYSYKATEAGVYTITITCGETVKTLIATITKLDIDVTPITAGLVFDFNPVGMSNNDADRLWSTDTVAMTVSDNFDWTNGGYQIDDNGDQYFCIKVGTSAEINYQMFADDAKRNGKEMKLVFKTTNVAKPNTRFLHCLDDTTGDNHIGIEMFSQEAYIYGQTDKLHLPYSEDDIIEFEFNISKDTEDIPMVMGYEDGVSTRPMVYDENYNFTQNTPKVISLGSDDCDLHIYRFKVYNTSLTAGGILKNFIADARNAEEMISRYDRNQIYDENNQLDPDILAEKCPWLRVYKLSAPYFTNNKSDKVPNTTIQQIYKDGDVKLDNWICYNAQHSGQGTSSNNYGAAGRNLDFIMNKSGIDGVKPYFVLGDGSEATEITLTRTSVPVAYLNAKVNIASSNNLTNAMLARRYNEFNPYSRPFVRDEGVDTSFIKDTMEFYNCVIFIQETNDDLSTHREFADKNWHLYAIGNIGDSKKTDNTRLTDINDKYECCIEVMDVGLPLSDFPADTMMNAMGYKEDADTGVKTYTWAIDDNLGILYELIDGEYVLTNDTTVDLTKTYYVDILEHDDFSEDYTYGWRYISDDEDTDVISYCHQKWIDFYRFVTTSTDEEFKAGLKNYFVVDSALYYYLFTTRYCMVDNRAKNSFYHYSKTGEVDSDGNPIRKWDLTWGYDMDTSMGLNNYGKQVYRYGLEDTDVDDGGQEVFRESDSRFFCRIRDLFSSDLKTMYNTLESKNAWHAESFLNKCDEWQSQFPEELWRLDIDRKYIRTYNSSFINGKGDDTFLTTMANGKMKYHRRQWERNQEKYMASKYQSSSASSDTESVVIRCASIPDGSRDDMVIQPNYTLTLTPYAYMYLNVQYGDNASPTSQRAVPNVEYEIPFTGNSVDGIKVYSSSMLQSIGDLSPCYATVIRVQNASKLKALDIGNSTEGYDNPYLNELAIGSNYLLEKLNIENVSGYTGSLNLGALNNLRELYAHGTNVGGVTFADSGLIEVAELPAITSMTMKNLVYLTTLDVVSFDKLTTLTVENCDTIDLVTILESAANVNRVRIIGVDWTLEDTSLLEKLYSLAGIDSSGYNTSQSIVSGKVFVPVIRQQQLYDYQKSWPDLEITFNTMIEQFPVTFVNEDGTPLDVQYVDKGEDAVDPLTREVNPIPTPTKESTDSTYFTFAGWDSPLTAIFGARTITATYSESTRSYTIKYVSMGTTLQTSTGLYGENVIYEGPIPTYTGEENGYRYHLFNRWDKSGFIDGNKTVNAIFDSVLYTADYFANKEIADMTPVEIYALTRMGLDNVNHNIEEGDDFSFDMGYDIDFDDIESQEIISEKISFDGTNKLDTGIALFDEDKDFVIAIDYKMSSNNSVNPAESVDLAGCYHYGDSHGFRLSYDGGVKLNWCGTDTYSASVDCREMVVLRHKKGSPTVTIYTSNIESATVGTTELTATQNFVADNTLVFGCKKINDGDSYVYEDYAIGDVYWCKVWYADLGDKACRELASWTHETINLEVCSFKKYYLAENSSKRCSFTLLASQLLDRNRPYSNTNYYNSGGWAKSSLNTFLNTRFYNAMPVQIKSLIKQVSVPSTIGDKSSDISKSACYVFIPSIAELTSSYAHTPYSYEGATISYMTSDDMRRRTYPNGIYGKYWTRSPNAEHDYFWYIEANGSPSGFTGGTATDIGVLIQISF